MQLQLPQASTLPILLLQLALTFAKVGLFTFGSGYAMLALMERELVQRHMWLTTEQFADVVSVAEITPGPITVNMATFVGYRIAGYLGAVVATMGLIVEVKSVLLFITVLCSVYFFKVSPIYMAMAGIVAGILLYR